MVNIKGNVDYAVHSQQQTTSPPHVLDQPEQQLITEAFFEWGLVEVLLTTNETQVWHDAYIIDIEKEPMQASKETGVSSSTVQHTCKFVLALDGEEPLTTLSEAQKDIQKCRLEQVRLKLKLEESNLHFNGSVST